VFLIHADEDCDDYLLDPLDEDVDATMGIKLPDNIKVENADDIQKEHRRLINAKRTQHRHRAVEMNQQGSGNLYDSSTSDLRTIINTARDTRNVIIARQQEHEEVEAYSPPTINSLSTTWRQLEEQSTCRKNTLSLKERFEEALHRQCPWHLKSKNSVFECQSLWRALGAPPKLRRKATGLPE
jgi:hypothetical protein